MCVCVCVVCVTNQLPALKQCGHLTLQAKSRFYEVSLLLEYDSVSLGNRIPTFRRNTVHCQGSGRPSRIPGRAEK